MSVLGRCPSYRGVRYERVDCIIIYRPPNSNPDVYMSLEKMIDVSTSTYNEVIVVGDFNVYLVTVKGSYRLSTIFQDAGMKQKHLLSPHKSYPMFGCAARSCLCYAS